MKTTYRQGDVLVIAKTTKPKAAAPVKPEPKGIVLAHGEVTGHAHAIAPNEAKLYRVGDDPIVSYLEVREAMALLRHDEHRTVELPKGGYEVRRQQQYTPKEIVRVAD